MNQKLPQHVAIVMDGNGRWAEKQGLERIEGHRAGVNTVKTIVQSCLEKNIPVLSLFAFSSENWARPAAEVEFLMHLFLQVLQQEIEALCQQGIALRFIGDRTQLSPILQAEMSKAEMKTELNQKLILNLALNYGGKWDILQAAKALIAEAVSGQLSTSELDEHTFAAQLSTHGLPEVDLLIRTSGEQRISNFFLWQLAYTELYFSEVNWPDFSGGEFEKALACFTLRKRRYGQIDV